MIAWDHCSKDDLKTFKLAVIAKPDHANARYNLAAAYRENDQKERAKAELQVVLTLVEPGTQDHETAQKELEALEVLESDVAGATDTTEQGGTLTPPEETETILSPPIELPEGSEPEISPTPTSSPSPTPEESPSSSPTPTASPTPSPT